jgi:hypothetical protein
MVWLPYCVENYAQSSVYSIENMSVKILPEKATSEIRLSERQH